MLQKMELEWPEIKNKVTASLLKEEEPELCEALWRKIETPAKLFCRHTLSTGYVFMGEQRPPRHPVQAGTQAVPLGRKEWLPSRIEPGSVIYSGVGGYGGITVYYGPSTTPLRESGSPVAKVDRNQLDDLVRGGEYVFNAQYMTHRPSIMIVRRVK